jgi:octaprenyl-diphosphate synthase
MTTLSIHAFFVRGHMMTIHRLKTLVSDDFEAVNALILERIQSQVDLIDALGSHIIQSGGKRLRPLLVLLACHACNYQGKEHITLAAMIEFFHTATLLHDDVIDESTLRRGRETANEIWGSKASILVGDFLFIQYMHLMIEVGDLDIMKLLNHVAQQISCGEIKQLANRHNYALSLDEYLDVIRSKTSLLFASSVSIAALITKSSPDIQQGLYTYGLHLGNAFQLIDDALDYCSDAQTIGKNIGDDLADGKATLPLLHVLKHGTPTQQNKIRESLEQGTLEYLPEILTAIEETKAIDYTRMIATKEVDIALSALQILPDSVYKEALAELAQYAIDRNY